MLLFYLAAWFVFSQAVLMKYCTCLKRRRRLSYKNFINNKSLGSPWDMLSTHRGGSFERTENTISAFKHSIELGIDLLECDVHLTKDGVVLIAHDEDFKRLCGVDKKIADTPYEAIPLMKRTIGLHFSDSLYNLLPEEEGKFATLRELFEIAPHKMISIDLKGDHNDLKHKVNELIKEFGRESLTIWGSMKPKQHQLIANLNPEVPRFFSAMQVLLVYILYFLGLLFLYPLPADAFMVPLMTQHKLKLFKEMIKARGAGFLAKLALFVLWIMLLNSKNLYRHLRKRGATVIVWVLNQDSEWEEALTFAPEIDGMMTDCPTKLKAFIHQHKND